jgi:NitT/TauT family transport system substrate-binding protein
MKKTVVLVSLLILGLLVPLMANGTKEQGEAYRSEEATVKVMALKGPTAMGMVNLMKESESGPIDGNTYTFKLAGAVDEVTAALLKGEVDIAALPANLGSVLYNNTKGKVTALAINTLGVIYIVESGSTIKSVADLKGKTIFASGKGATPEYGLNYVLRANGLEPGKDVQIEWKSEHAECVAAISATENGIAMLPQPFVTTAQMKNPKIRIALDLTKEWEAKSGGSSMITGIAVVRTDYLKEHKNAVDKFLVQYKASVASVNSDTDGAAKLIGSYGIVPEAVAKKALPYCNIVCITGTEMKTKLSGYLAELYAQNPKAVGGKLPEDAFYHI